ncbi:hypothetical protein M1O52_00605 [Dehalococcoidia bacterium]|nr:hypothetical protein [Dehalococcoidia bacterium]
MFRIRINECKPPWRILTALILVALVLAAPAYLAVNSRVLAASGPEIVVEDADSVQEFDLVEPAETLVSLAGEVMPRIIIQHAWQIIHRNLTQIPAKASSIADRVRPRIIVQHAWQIIHHNLIQAPAEVSILADRVRPRIIVQHAWQIIHHNLIEIPMPQFAINAIAQAREAIEAGRVEGLNMAEAEDILRQAERALAADDFERAISLAEQAKTKAEGIKGDAEAAIEEIDKAREVIEARTAEGLDMAEAEDLLRQAERALAEGDFGEAISLARQAETKAEGIRRAAALEQIDQAKEAITTGRAEGLDMAEAEDLLRQAERALAGGDYGEATSLAQQAETKVEGIRRAAALEQIEQAKEASTTGRAEGLDMAEAETLLSRAEEALARGDFGRAISLAEQAKTKAEGIKGDAEAAIEEIDKAREVIEARTAEGLDMAEAEDLLRQAERALAEGDFGEAISLARQAETKAEGIRRAAALEQIDQAKEAITTGRAEGLDMAEAEDLLRQAERALAGGDYGEATSLAQQAEVTAQEVKGEAQAALDAINQARDAIEEGIDKRLDMTEAEGVLSQAEETLAGGDFGGAISLARQAKAKAEEITRELRLARSSIEEARQVISEERAKGFDVVEAESSLSQAESAFDDREYERAVELAATAKSLALDVDRDGTLNHEDFAPTINNNHIYMGAFLLVLGLISVSAGISFRRRREKAEKEEIERKKRAILEMIDEVVNEGRS